MSYPSRNIVGALCDAQLRPFRAPIGSHRRPARELFEALYRKSSRDDLVSGSGSGVLAEVVSSRLQQLDFLLVDRIANPII